MKNKNLKNVRRTLLVFMILLFLSGLTAIPVDWQLSIAVNNIPENTVLHHWLYKVLTAYGDVKSQYPFLLYGYDWLAFAHFVLTILFIGAYRDPVKNIWVIEFGLIACVLVIPYAFVAGAFRDIPLGWRLIDCCFGVFGFAVLWYCHRKVNQLINGKTAHAIS